MAVFQFIVMSKDEKENASVLFPPDEIHIMSTADWFIARQKNKTIRSSNPAIIWRYNNPARFSCRFSSHSLTGVCINIVTCRKEKNNNLFWQRLLVLLLSFLSYFPLRASLPSRFCTSPITISVGCCIQKQNCCTIICPDFCITHNPQTDQHENISLLYFSADLSKLKHALPPWVRVCVCVCGWVGVRTHSINIWIINGWPWDLPFK